MNKEQHEINSAVFEFSLILHIVSSVRTMGHFVMPWNVLPLGNNLDAMALAAEARTTFSWDLNKLIR